MPRRRWRRASEEEAKSRRAAGAFFPLPAALWSKSS